MAGLLKAKGEFKGVEFHFKGKSSVVKTGEMSARIIMIAGEPCLIAMIRDVSERIESQKALFESEQRFRLLAENSADIISRHDYTGIIDYVSPSVSIYGYDPDSCKGKKPDEYVHPDDMTSMKEYWRKVLKANEPITAVYRFMKRDGSSMWVECRSVPIRDKTSGRVTEVHIATRDIDARKIAEEALNELTVTLEKKVRERTAQLAASNEELEAFAYSVSHDLRAPLRSMDGFSQALLEDYADKLDARGVDYLNRIRTSSRRMGQLIDDLLRLSRVTRSEMNLERVNLSLMARDIFDELGAREPQRKVEFICGDDYTIEADSDLIRIALTNLLSNAWKFTSKRTDACIELGMISKGKNRIFYIKDNGAGFDQTYVSRLFGPFQRLHTTGEFEGNGIGLAMVKKIIRRHGGSVRAEGSVGGGAVFFFSMDCLLDSDFIRE